MDLGSGRHSEITRNILDRVSDYVKRIYSGAEKLTDRYHELSPEQRGYIEEGFLDIAGYLGPIITGHPELIPIIRPVLDQVYRTIKGGYAGNELRKSAGEVKDTIEYLGRYLDESRGKSTTDSQPQKPRDPQSNPMKTTAIASIIGLSILGLGFSLRLGTETTGKVGSVTSTSLPFLLMFLVILLFTGFYVVKNKKN